MLLSSYDQDSRVRSRLCGIHHTALTVWNLYERSTGGITFVLNSGNHWMHNASSGGNWFIQLSGWLPVTGDTADLPDPELYPASLAPPADDPQELADRELLRRRPGLEAALRADQQVAESCSSEASARAAAAAKLLTEADAALAAVTGQLRSSNEAVTQAAARLASAEEGALGAVASAVAARERLLASKGALAEAEQAATKETPRAALRPHLRGQALGQRSGDCYASGSSSMQPVRSTRPRQPASLLRLRCPSCTRPWPRWRPSCHRRLQPVALRSAVQRSCVRPRVWPRRPPPPRLRPPVWSGGGSTRQWGSLSARGLRRGGASRRAWRRGSCWSSSGGSVRRVQSSLSSSNGGSSCLMPLPYTNVMYTHCSCDD